MLTRAAAIESIAGQHFEVVVIGGGITGAGVALDAASRGYSVALLERGDYAVGTSSRSSKMVHGGLRYLQNFDLGLVREALLERQLMVQLAPHLVYPTPFLVAAAGRGAARPQTRPRSEHVRRDGDDAGRPQPPRAALLQGGGRGLLLVAGPPPHDRPRGGPGDGPGAGRARTEGRLPLLRLPDRRRAPGPDRSRRGRALRRGDAERRRRHRGALRRRQRHRRRLRRGRVRRADRGRAPTTSSTRPASGPTASAPRRSSTRRTCRGSRPAAAPTCCSTRPTCRWATPPASSRPARAG